ncbi:hypothetical protein AMECASPLE_004190 [Ameca splendens]|uniref:Uncharacterized protein n=1 Tax=Ameca splendens TaxID=208324 RepID=A0ABV0YY60_9TELE
MVPSDRGGGETGILKKKPGVTRAKPLDSICRFHRSRGEGDGWGWPWGESETGGPNPHQLVLQPASGGSRGNFPVSSSSWRIYELGQPEDQQEKREGICQQKESRRE